MKPATRKVDTTLGEIVAVLNDVALELCSDEREANLLVSLALEDIFLDDAFRKALCALISVTSKRPPEERLARIQ